MHSISNWINLFVRAIGCRTEKLELGTRTLDSRCLSFLVTLCWNKNISGLRHISFPLVFPPFSLITYFLDLSIFLSLLLLFSFSFFFSLFLPFFLSFFLHPLHLRYATVQFSSHLIFYPFLHWILQSNWSLIFLSIKTSYFGNLVKKTNKQQNIKSMKSENEHWKSQKIWSAVTI